MQLCGSAEMKQKNDELNAHVCSLYLKTSSQQVPQHTYFAYWFFFCSLEYLPEVIISCKPHITLMQHRIVWYICSHWHSEFWDFQNEEFFKYCAVRLVVWEIRSHSHSYTLHDSEWYKWLRDMHINPHSSSNVRRGLSLAFESCSAYKSYIRTKSSPQKRRTSFSI